MNGSIPCEWSIRSILAICPRRSDSTVKNKKQARYVLAVKDSRAAERIEKVCFQTEIKDTLFKYIFFVLFFLTVFIALP